MNLNDKIRDKAIKIQYSVEKAEVLAKYVLESDETPAMCYSPTFFINMMLDEISGLAEEIECSSFEIKD